MKRFYLTCLLFLALILTGCAHTGQNVYLEDGRPLRGYDPVAYFTEGMPVEGQQNISYSYQGAMWQFASTEHRDLFAANPEKYAPQYGGFCAYAMSNGFFVSSDPQAWTLHEDKLYLNYSLGVRERWSKDIPKYVMEADAHWAKHLEK